MRPARTLCKSSLLLTLVAAGAMMSACAGVKTAAPAGSGGVPGGAGGEGGKPPSGTGAGGTGVIVQPPGNGACTKDRKSVV